MVHKSPHRPFYESVFSALSQGDLNKYFTYFDEQAKWIFHGEHPFAGTYDGLPLIKECYDRYAHLFQTPPVYTLRRLVVEGDKAVALLFDEGIKKDGKQLHIDYWLYLELRPDGQKIAKVENFSDQQKLTDLWSPKPQKKIA